MEYFQNKKTINPNMKTDYAKYINALMTISSSDTNGKEKLQWKELAIDIDADIKNAFET